MGLERKVFKGETYRAWARSLTFLTCHICSLCRRLAKQEFVLFHPIIATTCNFLFYSPCCCNSPRWSTKFTNIKLISMFLFSLIKWARHVFSFALHPCLEYQLNKIAPKSSLKLRFFSCKNHNFHLVAHVDCNQWYKMLSPTCD